MQETEPCLFPLRSPELLAFLFCLSSVSQGLLVVPSPSGRWLGLGRSLFQLQPGKRADLILNPLGRATNKRPCSVSHSGRDRAGALPCIVPVNHLAAPLPVMVRVPGRSLIQFPKLPSIANRKLYLSTPEMSKNSESLCLINCKFRRQKIRLNQDLQH